MSRGVRGSREYGVLGMPVCEQPHRTQIGRGMQLYVQIGRGGRGCLCIGQQLNQF